MVPAIHLQHIRKTFHDEDRGGLRAIESMSLDIAPGEFFVFVGPSGCGKSTLLRIIAGLDSNYDGTCTLGPDIAPSDIAFVFQQFALLPWLTVRQNIELNLLARDLTSQERKERIARELTRFHLEKFAEHSPKQLSGGLRQRVGIARALASDPKIILMDEPFSELDSFTAQELRQEFLNIWKDSRPTIVMVTHLIPEALELADRIAVVSQRPAKIITVLTNTLPRPRAKRSPDFFALEDQLFHLIAPAI